MIILDTKELKMKNCNYRPLVEQLPTSGNNLMLKIVHNWFASDRWLIYESTLINSSSSSRLLFDIGESARLFFLCKYEPVENDRWNPGWVIFLQPQPQCWSKLTITGTLTAWSALIDRFIGGLFPKRTFVWQENTIGPASASWLIRARLVHGSISNCGSCLIPG